MKRTIKLLCYPQESNSKNKLLCYPQESNSKNILKQFKDFYKKHEYIFMFSSKIDEIFELVFEFSKKVLFPNVQENFIKVARVNVSKNSETFVIISYEHVVEMYCFEVSFKEL